MSERVERVKGGRKTDPAEPAAQSDTAMDSTWNHETGAWEPPVDPPAPPPVQTPDPISDPSQMGPAPKE
jgi:hypothetical protein